MASWDHMTEKYIDGKPADRWAVIVEPDGEYVAVRSGWPSVMTHGCVDLAIRDAADAETVCGIVAEYIRTRPDAIAADRARVEAGRVVSEEARIRREATDIAIEKRIRDHEAACKARGVSPKDRSEVASDVTIHEIDMAVWRLRGCPVVPLDAASTT